VQPHRPCEQPYPPQRVGYVAALEARIALHLAKFNLPEFDLPEFDLPEFDLTEGL
jgi:hypothetical protein